MVSNVANLAAGGVRLAARTTIAAGRLSYELLRHVLPGGDRDGDRYAPAAPPPPAPPRPAAPERPEPAAAAPPPAPEAKAPTGATGQSLALPIDDYDALTADQVVARLGDLDATQLAAVEGYERAGRNRRRVLDRVAALRRRRTDEELSEVVAAEPADQ